MLFALPCCAVAVSCVCVRACVLRPLFVRSRLAFCFWRAPARLRLRACRRALQSRRRSVRRRKTARDPVRLRGTRRGVGRGESSGCRSVRDGSRRFPEPLLSERPAFRRYLSLRPHSAIVLAEEESGNVCSGGAPSSPDFANVFSTPVADPTRAQSEVSHPSTTRCSVRVPERGLLERRPMLAQAGPISVEIGEI